MACLSKDSIREFIRDTMISDNGLTANMYNNKDVAIDLEDDLDLESADRLIFGDLAEDEREQELKMYTEEIEKSDSIDIAELADKFLKGDVD